MYDVIIIGAGVIGSSIARELSRYKLNICVLEKEIDVAMGTTKANSAIVHSGYDAPPETLKGKLNAKGNSMFDVLSKELDFPFKRNGSLVLCFNEKDIHKLKELRFQGIQNGVPDIKILKKEEVLEIEPNLSDKVVAALFVPSGGIVCPYEMTIALAENAVRNGVKFFLENKVNNIKKTKNGYSVITDKGIYDSKLIINAAGLYSDVINNLVSSNKLDIIPRKGEYCLFDKAVGNLVSRTIFQLPTSLGKGVLVTPTVDGNLIVGPNAEDIDDKNDLTTTSKGIEEIIKKAKLSIDTIPMNSIITSFSGLRARLETEDFIIEEQRDAKGFINVAGIQSPGLSSAPAIALMVKDIVFEIINPEKNDSFNPIRKGFPKFREMNNDERRKLIEENPSFGKIICRCENVTEAEVIASIRGPLGAKTLDGVKRRTRAGMGRCQAGFCSTRILDILSKELKINRTDVTKFGGKSNVLVSVNKGK